MDFLKSEEKNKNISKDESKKLSVSFKSLMII